VALVEGDAVADLGAEGDGDEGASVGVAGAQPASARMPARAQGMVANLDGRLTPARGA